MSSSQLDAVDQDSSAITRAQLSLAQGDALEALSTLSSAASSTSTSASMRPMLLSNAGYVLSSQVPTHLRQPPHLALFPASSLICLYHVGVPNGVCHPAG